MSELTAEDVTALKLKYDMWGPQRDNEDAPIIRALISAWEAQQWRPIETVPRDETRVLIGHFQDGPYYGRIRVDWYRRPETNAGFIGFGEFNKAFYPATHWMPLPKPPGEQA